MNKTNMEETQELMAKLLTVMSFEEIASSLQKNYYTVYRWARGKGKPDKANLTALIKLYEPFNTFNK